MEVSCAAAARWPLPPGSGPADFALMADPGMGSTRVGDQAGALDPGDGTGFVVPRAVPADPDRTEQVPMGVADQHASASNNDAFRRGWSRLQRRRDRQKLPACSRC